MDFKKKQPTVTFATRLKELREKSGQSQSSLEKKAGLAPTHISQFECGHREPTVSTLRKIKEALGCSWNKLLD